MKSVFTNRPSVERIVSESRDMLKTRRIETAMTYLPSHSKVLEIGCSWGYVSYHMAVEKCCSVDAYDIAEDRIQMAREHFGHERIRFIAQDILSVANRSEYDAVILLETIEHVEDPVGLLKHLFGFLKPGGSLILSTPNANDYLQSVRNLKLYGRRSRANKAQYVEERNRVKHGDRDDHLYAWTWETLWRLLNRVGFEYRDSDIVGFRPVIYGRFRLFRREKRVLERVLRPYCTSLVFQVRRRNA